MATVVIFVAVVVGVLISTDLEPVREQLETQGTAAFGRSLQIDGAIDVRPSLQPEIVFEDVVIANPDWTSRPYFAKAKRLQVKVALLPLLRGELEVIHVVFDGADLLLETRPDGINNYTFGAQDDGPTVLPDIQRFSISESVIGNRYPDQSVRTVAITEAKFTNIEGQPVTIDGEARYRELPVRFSFVGGNPSEIVNPTKPWPVNLSLNIADASFNLDGHVAKPLTWEGGNYRITIKGEQIQTLGQEFAMNLPSVGPYQVSAQVRTEDRHYYLTDISSSIQGNENLPDLEVFEGAASASADEPMHLELGGEYGDVPFALDMKAGAYTELLATVVDWPVKLSARLAEMNLDAEGVLSKQPEGGPAVDVKFVLNGEFGNQIPPLFGFESPVSGPITLSARVTGTNQRFAATDLAGQIAQLETVGQVTISQGAISAGAGEPTELNLTGTIDEASFTTVLEGGSITELVAGNMPWPIKIDARAGGAIFSADGTLDGFDHRPEFSAQVALSGDNFASLNPLLRANLPRIGPYEISTHVRHTADGVLTLSGLSGQIKDSDLSGEFRFKYTQPKPKTSWKLVSKNLHLDQLFLAREGRAAGGNVFDQPININWFPGVSDEASLKIDNLYGLGVPIRNASIEEKLSANGDLTVDPIRMTVAGSVIDASFRGVEKNGVPVVTLNAQAVGIDVGKTLKRLKLGDNVRGKAEVLAMNFKSRGGTVRSWLENAQGAVTIKRANLSIYNPLKDNTIPFQAVSAEVLTKPRSPLKLSMAGRVRSVPVNLNAEIGTLANTVIARKPWPLKVSLRSANTTLKAKGKVAHPTEGRGFDVDFELNGEELRKGFPLIGFVVPLVGSYRVKGHFSDDPGRYRFTNLQSRIGNSDLAGYITIETHGRRPHVIARLASHTLDLNDVVLRDVDTKTATASTSLIPDYTIPDEALGTVDLDLDGSAERVVVGTDTLGDLAFKVDLEGGRFILSPFKITGLANSKIKAKYYHDANADPPTSSIQVNARNVDYGLLLKRLGVTDLVEGKLDVDAYLAGPGGTRRRFLSEATGQINIVGGQGKFASRKLDRWAADLTTTMLTSAWEREDVTNINCVVARINVDKGIAKSNEMLVDTKRITIAGSGALDLQDEKIDLVLAPDPKKPSLVSLANPVRIKGPLSSPKVSQEKFAKKGRRIVGLAVGALSGFFVPAIPVAVLLTFSDIGTIEQNPCVAAIDKASDKAGKNQRDESALDGSGEAIPSITDQTID